MTPPILSNEVGDAHRFWEGNDEPDHGDMPVLHRAMERMLLVCSFCIADIALDAMVAGFLVRRELLFCDRHGAEDGQGTQKSGRGPWCLRFIYGILSAHGCGYSNFLDFGTCACPGRRRRDAVVIHISSGGMAVRDNRSNQGLI
jgi:hypothetical protein